MEDQEQSRESLLPRNWDEIGRIHRQRMLTCYSHHSFAHFVIANSDDDPVGHVVAWGPDALIRPAAAEGCEAPEKEVSPSDYGPLCPPALRTSDAFMAFEEYLPVRLCINGRAVRCALPGDYHVICNLTSNSMSDMSPNEELYCYGANAKGQCFASPDDHVVITEALPVQPLVAHSKRPTHMCTADSTVTLDALGRIWDSRDRFNRMPNHVFKMFGVRDIAVGFFHYCILLGNGDVYGFGESSSGQLARRNGDCASPYLHNVSCLGLIALASAGYHCVGVDYEGKAWVWGQSVGLGNRFIVSPNVVPLPDRFVIGVSCGEYHTLLLDNQRHVWAFGDRNALGTRASYTSPRHLSDCDHLEVQSIASNARESVLLSRDGSLHVMEKGRVRKVIGVLGEPQSVRSLCGNACPTVKHHWSPKTHHQFPYVFRCRVRCVLLAHCRGVLPFSRDILYLIISMCA